MKQAVHLCIGVSPAHKGQSFVKRNLVVSVTAFHVYLQSTTSHLDLGIMLLEVDSTSTFFAEYLLNDDWVVQSNIGDLHT